MKSLPLAPADRPRAGAPAFRYSLSAFLTFTVLIGLAFVAGFQIGRYQGYDRGYRDGFDHAPLFDATHPKIGPLIEARPRNARD